MGTETKKRVVLFPKLVICLNMQFVMDCQLLRVLLDSSVRSAANGDKGTKEMLEEILMERSVLRHTVLVYQLAWEMILLRRSNHEEWL